jgi:hypothetical protein
MVKSLSLRHRDDLLLKAFRHDALDVARPSLQRASFLGEVVVEVVRPLQLWRDVLQDRVADLLRDLLRREPRAERPPEVVRTEVGDARRLADVLDHALLSPGGTRARPDASSHREDKLAPVGLLFQARQERHGGLAQRRQPWQRILCSRPLARDGPRLSCGDVELAPGRRECLLDADPGIEAELDGPRAALPLDSGWVR